MPRLPTGSVIVRRRTNGITYAVRFTANGERHYRTLSGCGSKRDAEKQLRVILGEVAAGRFEPEPAPAPAPSLTLYDFTEATWWPAHARGLAARTVEQYRWRLDHLDRLLGHVALAELTPRTIDAAREQALEDGMSAYTWNAVCKILAQVLDLAVEYDVLGSNPARSKRRLANHRAKRGAALTDAEAMRDLLDAAGRLDARATAQPGVRRAAVALLMFAGVRRAEAAELRWADVDLANGRVVVRGTKTNAAQRVVPMLPALRDELAAWKAATMHAEPTDHVLATVPGRAWSPENINQRIVKRATGEADRERARLGRGPLPDLTAHALRRTAATLWAALGDPWTMNQTMRALGHESARLTLEVYARAGDFGERQLADLRRLAGAETSGAPRSEPAPTAAKAG